jgi:gamma-butyrobetaine dioxygenase
MPHNVQVSSFQVYETTNLNSFTVKSCAIGLTIRVCPFCRHDDSLTISWNDQHETKLPLTWLRENCYSRSNLEARRNRQQPYLWDVPAIEKRGGFPQFEYEKIMKDDKAVWEWVKALNKYGCALVVNGPTAEGSVVGLTERYAKL